MNFELVHENGQLFAVVEIDGVVHRKDVTEYFKNSNPHDDWLDYRIGLKTSNSFEDFHYSFADSKFQDD